MAVLLVPIRVDALHLPAGGAVAGPDADFSLQPYAEGGTNHNPNTPNLSEFIVRTPFKAPALTLESGIHLHWALPDFLTRGQSAAGPGQPISFPRVPNRWLVTRFDNRPAASIQRVSFLVESDFIHPRSAGDVATSPNIPAAPDSSDGRPFRYLGRTSQLDGTTDFPTPGSKFLDNLTAAGYGSPTFAGYYPNCRNVFGMRDPISVQPGELRFIEYTIIGWYSDATNDVVAARRRSGATPPAESDLLQLKTDLGFRLMLSKPQVEGLFGTHANTLWSLMHEKGFLAGNPQGNLSEVLPDPGPVSSRDAITQANLDDIRGLLTPFRAIPEHLECYAHIQLTVPPAQPPARTIASLTLGGTTTEALASHLALRVSTQDAQLTADQIDAVLLGEQLEFLQADVPQKLAQTKHRTGFRAVSAETLWVVSRASAPTGLPDEGDIADLPASLAKQLHDLNQIQAAYDNQKFETEATQRQLFADWCKYMRQKYAPVQTGVDMAALRSFINTHSVPDIEARQDIAGQFTVRGQFKVDGRIADDHLALINNTTDKSLARRVALAAKAVQDAIDQFNNSRPPSERPVVLFPVPGQRFWAPSDPAVVLTGSGVDPNDRHTPGILDATVVGGSTADRTSSILQEAGAERRALVPIWPIQSCDAPWNPLILDWRAQYTPRPIFTPAGDVDPNAIRRIYELDADAADMRPITAPAANQTPVVFTGSTLLTPHASSRLQQTLEVFLRTEIAEGRITGLNVPRPDEPLDAARIANLITLLANDRLRLPIARAFSELLSTPCLGQSLSGFNDALLGLQPMMQLPVADPLGTDADRAFADKVRAKVGPFNGASPVVNPPFFPIRAGEMRVSEVRIIDAFGQTLNFTPQPPANPLSGENFAVLTPRVVQPFRLSFRWVSAADNSIDVNSHPESTPVCGWLLPDFIGENVLVYDSDGGMLGSILPDPDPDAPAKARWEPAPGGKGATTPADFVNQPLRHVVENLRGHGGPYINKFIQALDSALDKIHPPTVVGHGALALLSGRALAVVRAVLFFELRDLPAANQSFDALRADMAETRLRVRKNGNFPFTTFRLRLGDHGQIDDGLAAWTLLDTGLPLTDTPWVFTAHSDSPGAPSDPAIILHDSPGAQTILPISFDSLFVTMLLDPHGTVHSITGVAPTKELSIPRDQFVSALHSLEVTFRAGPILSPLNRVNLPLSLEPSYDWSWIQRDKVGWSEVSTQGLIEKPRVLEAFPQGEALWTALVDNGWLKLLDPFQAGIVPKQLRKAATLGPALDALIPDVETFLTRFQIGAAETTAAFPKQGIRDGWLMLAEAVDFSAT